MTEIGQGCPTLRSPALRWRVITAAALAALLLRCAPALAAEEITARLRFAWGSTAQTALKWQGEIVAEGAKLDALQPLGIEADEAAAVRLVDGRIVVAPLVLRAFDGCDVTISGADTAVISLELRSAADAAPTRIQATLAELARQRLHRPLDDLGSYLLAERAPGDLLPVRIARDHLVFRPGESLQVLVSPDLKAEAAQAAVTIQAELRPERGGDALWKTSKPYDPASAEPLAIDVTAPAKEGAYRVMLTATQPAEGLAGRLAPWEEPRRIASRDVAFVVVDPLKRLPRLTEKWETVAAVDPTDMSWRQRLPQWSSLDKLPAFSNPRPLGNVKVLSSPPGLPGFVQLPPQQNLPAPAGAEPAWQAYSFSVKHVGEPHAVEIELPRAARQHLDVSIVEPDAAGRVYGYGRDCGVYCNGRSLSAEGVEVHRVAFWPRTKSPVVLLANRSSVRPASYGKIRLVRRSTEPEGAPTESPADSDPPPPGRLVAAYIATPRFADALGASESLDAASGLSVDSWQTFLDGANRLAQQLHAEGYNAAVLSIAADGSSLTPIDALGNSPRYDTGPLAAAGSDPMRKDVLELLLRVFDREGLRLVPAVQLAAPLPALEAVRPAGDAKASSFTLIGADGQSWIDKHSSEAALAPHYNVLQPAVQESIGSLAEQLADRYERHPSLAGVALQLASNGYGVLPGTAWGFDDATVARFERDCNVTFGAAGGEGFAGRAAQLLGPRLPAWKQWRMHQLTNFYADVAQRLAAQRTDLRLVLCTEDLFAGANAAEHLRQAVAGRESLDAVLSEIAVDVRQLAAAPGVVLLRPRRIAAMDSIDSVALDERANSAPELDQAFASFSQSGELLFHPPSTVRLPSFDQQSPFGAGSTRFSLNSPSVSGGDAALEDLVAAFAGRETNMVVEGGDSLLLAAHDARASARRVFRALPAPSSLMQTARRQPLTMRVYRDEQATTICLLNESPWPTEATLPLECADSIAWRQLGAADDASAEAGTLAAGAQAWKLSLPAYGIAARRFASDSIRIGELAPQVAEVARADLLARIDAIEQRMQNLEVERPYNLLQNPQFELTGDNQRVPGWQPRIGVAGAVTLQEPMPESEPPFDSRAIRLQSDDATGVALQSHLFAMPDTGQLVVRAKIRAEQMKADARLYAWVEYPSGGVQRQRYVTLGSSQELRAQWTDCEFAIDDLPLGARGQMRIQFHLAGAGQVWIDDVRMYDLRFPQSQREALAKRLYAAKTALEEDQFMDCQRLVEGYWPRRLVEHLPPVGLASRGADLLPAAPEGDAKAVRGFNDRIRGIVPRIFR